VPHPRYWLELPPAFGFAGSVLKENISLVPPGSAVLIGQSVNAVVRQ
jgi:hypothetical protein